MENFKKIGIQAADLYHILCFEEFDCRMAYNKGKITCMIPHEIGEPLSDSQGDHLRRILREWLRDHFPDLPLAQVGDLVGDALSDPPGDRSSALAIRESWRGLFLVIHVGRVREMEQEAVTRKRAKDIGNVLLQNRDVYDGTISTRDIELIGSTVCDEGFSYRQSLKIMKLLERKDVGVAERNGNMRTKGRDLNINKLKAFLSR